MPTPTYTPLATVTLGSAASSVTFSSIPATYRDLVLVESFQHTTTGSQSLMKFGDTSTNYSMVTMRGNGSAANSATFSGDGNIGTSPGNTNNTANVQLTCVRHIMDYSATDKHKTILQRFSDTSQHTIAVAGRWANTSTITTIGLSNLSGNYAAGSSFALYGIVA
jgi:hypothetical protein